MSTKTENPRKRNFMQLNSANIFSSQSPLKRQRTYISTRSKSKSNKSLKRQSNKNNNEQMLLIGSCHRYLFGFLKYESSAYGEVKLRYDSKSICVDSIMCNNIALGQTDSYFSNAFGHLLQNKEILLKGKILSDDMSIQQRKLQRKKPSWFIRKLLIDIYSTNDIIDTIMDKCKTIKDWKWINYSSDIININNLEQGYDEMLLRLEADFNQIFNDDIAAHNLKGRDPNKDIVTTQLLSYQRIGFEWMSLRENFNKNGDEIPPFYEEIEDEHNLYRNIISNEEVYIDELPEVGCGGILADDMGLGKTLQTISLIASNNASNTEFSDKYRSTLIVTPIAVMNNWQRQIEKHCKHKSFKILIYHGVDRERDIKHIEKYDIVITTYGTLSAEYNDINNDKDREYMRKHYGIGLQYVNWLRVVLDEAHRIRSRKTKKFKSCHALYAKSRWCLTGTPLQNRLDDLYSLFCFLRLQPISNQSFWNTFIVNPLKNNQESGLQRLRTIVSYFCLRRLKKGLLTNLPPKKINTRRLQFIPKERAKYDQLLAIQKAQFIKMKNCGDKAIMRNFTSVLSMLLRLRQCCAHTLLLLDNDNLNQSQDINQECGSCGMPPITSILTSCNHIYCKDCFFYELETQSFPCYLCGDILTKKSIKDTTTQKDDDNNDNQSKICHQDNEIEIEPSTKMQTLINDILSWNDELTEGDLPNKAVVFSQWTSVLDLLQICLKKQEIQYERIDGSMSVKQRINAMDNFKNMDKNIKIILVSLKAGCEGIDLCVANHVYLLDPWWNPSTEDQAIDRVHRLGQTRTVYVNHFVIKDSVEEKILKIQERKRELISSTLQCNLEMKRNRGRELLNDLKELFDF